MFGYSGNPSNQKNNAEAIYLNNPGTIMHISRKNHYHNRYTIHDDEDACNAYCICSIFCHPTPSMCLAKNLCKENMLTKPFTENVETTKHRELLSARPDQVLAQQALALPSEISYVLLPCNLRLNPYILPAMP
jgi:hypothetical protein